MIYGCNIVAHLVLFFGVLIGGILLFWISVIGAPVSWKLANDTLKGCMIRGALRLEEAAAYGTNIMVHLVHKVQLMLPIPR